MSEQSYENHAQIVPNFHYTLIGVVLVALGGSLVNVFRAFTRGSGRLEAAVVLLLVVACVLLTWYVRIFALKAQDRAIRAEEQLRHYVLTGSLLDPRLRIRQIVGLRFASDEEFPGLAARAAEDGLGQKKIKQAIETWRPDTYRV